MAGLVGRPLLVSCRASHLVRASRTATFRTLGRSALHREAVAVGLVTSGRGAEEHGEVSSGSGRASGWVASVFQAWSGLSCRCVTTGRERERPVALDRWRWAVASGWPRRAASSAPRRAEHWAGRHQTWLSFASGNHRRRWLELNPDQKLNCLGELLILGEGAAARSSPKQDSAWRGQPRSCTLGTR
uniref:Uncharacterized protein n=1 Tax=Oryza meridionalis TaxID=40149 RepID=A0A0E0EAC3_9ORYZ